MSQFDYNPVGASTQVLGDPGSGAYVALKPKPKPSKGKGK